MAIILNLSKWNTLITNTYLKQTLGYRYFSHFNSRKNSVYNCGSVVNQTHWVRTLYNF